MTGRKWVDQMRAARARSAPPSRGSRSTARSARLIQEIGWKLTTEPGRINNGIRTENTGRNSSQRDYPHEQLWYSMEKMFGQTKRARLTFCPAGPPAPPRTDELKNREQDARARRLLKSNAMSGEGPGRARLRKSIYLIIN